MRPALLYGAEVITYSKKWINALEVAQNTIARFMTGTSQRASKVGLQGELGWRGMLSEIWERKLVYYGGVKNMGEERWPRIALQEMESEQRGNKWLKTIEEGMREIGVTYTGQGTKVWKRTVKRAITQWSDRVWKEGRASNEKLKEYPKEIWGGGGRSF